MMACRPSNHRNHDFKIPFSDSKNVYYREVSYRVSQWLLLVCALMRFLLVYPSTKALQEDVHAIA